MPAWFRKIRRINIFGFELEFDHSAGEPAKPVEDRAPTSINRRRPDPPVPANASPARLTVYGEVIGAIGKDLGLRIRNENEAHKFWRAHRIDTKLDWAGKGPPVFSIGRRQDSESCKPGDEASMTVEVEERAGGKVGIRTVAFEVLRSGATGA